MRIVTLDVGPARYNVAIGREVLGVFEIPPAIARADRVAIMASERVWALHAEPLARLSARFPECEVMLMPDGEEYKSYSFAESYFNGLLSKGLTRSSAIIVVGGGVAGDFAGYCAAMYMRGIAFVHVPTTLLAMVDSSIGGKVAVNIGAGKNIVGAFHQPSAVIDDIRFLETLPDSEMKNGLAETIKHALLGERRLYDLLMEHDLASVRDPGVLEELVFLSAGFKGAVVAGDERESGRRAILNLGHTVGHAMESAMAYRGISHGEAVAFGLRAAVEISARLGGLSGGEAGRFYECMERYGLMLPSLGLDPDELVRHMMFDKKNAAGKINFVLLEGTGNPVYNRTVDASLLRDVLGAL